MSNIPKIIGSLHKEKGKKTEDEVRGALDLLKDEEKIDQYVRSRDWDCHGQNFIGDDWIGRKNAWFITHFLNQRLAYFCSKIALWTKNVF